MWVWREQIALQLFCFPPKWQEPRSSTYSSFVRIGLRSCQAATVLHILEGILHEATTAAVGNIKSHAVQ